MVTIIRFKAFSKVKFFNKVKFSSKIKSSSKSKVSNKAINNVGIMTRSTVKTIRNLSAPVINISISSFLEMTTSD